MTTILYPGETCEKEIMTTRKGKAYECDRKLDKDPTKNRTSEIRHSLHSIEVVQLLNLCPESTEEAVTLIPTLKR